MADEILLKSKLVGLAIVATVSVMACAKDRASIQTRGLNSADSVPALWYEQSRTLDANGDGVADVLWLRADGTRADSLQVVFTITSQGREILREEWHSGYMLINPPFERPATSSVVDSFVRAELDSTLAGIELEDFAQLEFNAAWPPIGMDCQGDPRDCIAATLRREAAAVDWERIPSDSVEAVWRRIDTSPLDTAEVLAIGGDMRRHTKHYLVISYGYETLRYLAWSNRAQRFFPVFECC